MAETIAIFVGIPFVIGTGVVLGVGYASRLVTGRGGPMVCTDCRAVDYADIRTKGSIRKEILLWLCLIIPGLVYSLWRITSGRVYACSSCGSESIVPRMSSRGQEIIDAG
jgi:hypothetical protein